MQITLSKNALAMVDKTRAERGIRTRAKAVEVALSQITAEHPLETAIKNAPSVEPDAYEKERIEEYLQRQRNGTLKWFSGQDILAKAAELRKSRD